MPIGTLDPGTDDFDLDVNYGGLTYSMFFGGGPNCTPLPKTPPISGSQCLCPSCSSQGWYASSPACRFWRAHCELCSGTRRYQDYSEGRPPRRLPCDLCAAEWDEDVDWFRYALRSPRAAARKLREQAAAARAAREEAR